MKPKQKRLNKKMYKFFYVLAFVMLTVFVGSFTTLIVFNGDLPETLMAVISVTIVMSIILTVVFYFGSIIYRDKLKQYKERINLYRNRRKYCTCLHLIIDGKIKQAEIVMDSIPNNSSFKTLLFISFTHKYLEIDDVRGVIGLNKILDKYNPEKINLNI